MKKNVFVSFLFLVACGNTGQANNGVNNGGEELDESVVTTLTDVVNDADGEVSLREAIAFARVNDKTVTFKKGLKGTISYADGEIVLGDKDDVKILAEEPITLDAKSASRHFSSTGANLSLDGLTLVGGFIDGGVEGGASILFGSGTLKIENCEFKDNDNQSGVGGGGAIRIRPDGELTVSSSSFSANKTAASGASIWSESSSLLKIVDSTFNDHTTEGQGVVYHEGEGDFEISGGEFKNNKTDRGAIYISKVSGSASVDGLTFENNKADYGAAIFFSYSGTERDANKIDLTVKDSTFTANVGGNTGAVDASAFTTTTIEDCTFTENTADAESSAAGGAIQSGGALSVLRGEFTKNAVSSPNLAIPGSGGAISVSGLSAFDGLTVVDSNFVENSAGDGGAVYVGGAEKMEITNCTFAKNTAIVAGGAVAGSSRNSVISGGSFTDNKVTDDVGNANGGGAIHTSEDLSVTGVTITGNSAPVGGGIFIAISNLILGEGTVISNNTASRESGLPAGGGVCNSGSDITGSSVVTNNSPQDFCDDARAN